MTPGFAGCHGIRVDPPGEGSAFGVTAAEPLGALAVSPRSLTVGGQRLWSADVAGARSRHEMWRDGDGALTLTIRGQPVLTVDAARTQAAVGEVTDAVGWQLVSTFAVPMAAQRCGLLVLHACAAVRDERAVVVCAETGTGKSSLVIALAAAGWTVLSEDMVALDLDRPEPLAWPGPPWVRLDPALPPPPGATERFRTADKVGWDVGPWRHQTPAPVSRLVLLDPPSAEPTSLRTAGADEVMGALGLHTPWFEEPRERGRALFGSAVRVARRMPCSRLRLQRSADWRDEAVSLLNGLLSGGVTSS